MAFKDTIQSIQKKHGLSNEDISKVMEVSTAMVYRYREGSAEPRWKNVLLLLNGLGYTIKITAPKVTGKPKT